MPGGWSRPLGQGGGDGGGPSCGGGSSCGGSGDRYLPAHHTTTVGRGAQHYLLGTVRGASGPPSFSTLHQLSSSSAATPSPSSSSSSTPSSARLASRGVGGPTRGFSSRGVIPHHHGCSARTQLSSGGSFSSTSGGCKTFGSRTTSLSGGHGDSFCTWGGANQEDQAGAQNCAELSSVNEDSLVHNLTTRYKRDQIYVSV